MKRAACTLALQRRRLNQPNSTLGRSGETDSVKKSSGNHAVDAHPMPALKGRDRSPGLWPYNAVNHAAIVSKLTQASLHRSNRCRVITISWLVVRSRGCAIRYLSNWKPPTGWSFALILAGQGTANALIIAP